MNILFRADSSSNIGTGHIMRDLVLVNQFKADNIIFATRELKGNINYKIDEADYKKIILKTNEISELDKFIKELSIDMIVIDHYDIDYNFEKSLKEFNPNLKLFVLDDTYEKHYCDILLNHNIYADEKKYINLVPIDCELRCGAKFTLLRDEFIEAKKNKKIIKNLEKTILVAMGGSDIKNLNLEIIKVLSNFDNIKVDIVTTSGNENLNELKEFCYKNKWINLHINCNNIAEIMAKSDFAIITPSVTSNEVYFMELPFIAIKVANNQDDMYEYMKKNNYSVLEKFDSNKLFNLIKDFI